MTTTHQTEILDSSYTVRTVSTVEDSEQFVVIYVTNNANGVTIGGEKTKKPYAGSVSDLHKEEVAKSIDILGSGNKWQPRVTQGETLVINK